MFEEDVPIENLYFEPKSAKDTLNYFILASKIFVGTHEDVLPDDGSLALLLQGIISDYHVACISAESDAEKGKVNLATIPKLQVLLDQIEQAGCRLVFRMWSDLTPEIIKEVIDGEEYETVLPTSGAIVGFIIVPNTLPSMLPEKGNGHREVCVSNVPAFEHDYLAGF